MDIKQFIFLKSQVSDSNPEIQKDTDRFIKDMNISSIPYQGKVFFISSGGTEEIFKKIYLDYKPPYHIIATDSDNSLPAALEIVSFLNNLHLKNYLYHGTPDVVRDALKQRSKEIIEFNYEFKDNPELLKDMRLGVVGKPSDWLIASLMDKDEVKAKTGAELVDISFEEFKETIEESTPTSFEALKGKINHIIDESELKLALRIYSALKALVSKYKLNGLTVRCFDLLGTIHSTSCIALSLLNNEGIIAACEGDVPALISMMILKIYFNKLSFQCNPSYIDVFKNVGYFAHCTIPTDMCDNFVLDTHFESGIGVGIHGELKPTEITILKVNSDLKKFSCYSARIEENMYKSNLCRTQIKVRFFDPINQVLTSPCGNHLVVSYGDIKQDLLALLAK
jgi:L-fucose isomerase-like protein